MSSGSLAQGFMCVKDTRAGGVLSGRMDWRSVWRITEAEC